MNKLSAFGLQFVAWPCDACVKQPERSRCGGAPSGGRRSRGRIDHLLHGAFRRVQVTGERHDQSTLLTRLLLAVSAEHSWPAMKMLASVPHDVRSGGHGRKR